jgi:SAM-dependent methyltransferase
MTRPGLALDIGAAGGGNTRVIRARGWQAIATDYSVTAVEVARRRGLSAFQSDARQLPVRSGSCDLVTAFDVLEHVEEDYLVASEIARVLKRGGTALIAVPCDMSLWSAHDEAVGHVRRYSRATLAQVVQRAGLDVDSMWSWNVLLRPALALRRRSSTGSDLDTVPPVLNRVLTLIVVAERYLPVKAWPGSSLILRAVRTNGVVGIRRANVSGQSSVKYSGPAYWPVSCLRRCMSRSLSRLDAPIRNRSGVSQAAPAVSFTRTR